MNLLTAGGTYPSPSHIPDAAETQKLRYLMEFTLDHLRPHRVLKAMRSFTCPLATGNWMYCFMGSAVEGEIDLVLTSVPEAKVAQLLLPATGYNREERTRLVYAVTSLTSVFDRVYDPYHGRAFLLWIVEGWLEAWERVHEDALSEDAERSRMAVVAEAEIEASTLVPVCG